MSSTNFVIIADVFNSGGTEDSTSANFGIQDSIGEGLALSSTSTSANFGIKTGFREMFSDTYVTLSLGAAAVDLGNLSPTQTNSAFHTMLIQTNATNGFTARVTGTTLQTGGGASTITGIGATAAAPAIGTKQFGLNLVANATPAVGANPAGIVPIGSAADQYREADKFAFQSAMAVATSSAPINQTTYTVSYIANITSDTTGGSYATTLSYAATINP